MNDLYLDDPVSAVLYLAFLAEHAPEPQVRTVRTRDGGLMLRWLHTPADDVLQVTASDQVEITRPSPPSHSLSAAADRWAVERALIRVGWEPATVALRVDDQTIRLVVKRIVP